MDPGAIAATIELVADRALRQLERRLRETAPWKDEAAWLRERVRTQALRAERLELASILTILDPSS